MDNYTLTEQAYKNGYEQGLKDAVKHGRWLVVALNGCQCSECGRSNLGETSFCPNCGARMKG